jgi:hypothetical protein
LQPSARTSSLVRSCVWVQRTCGKSVLGNSRRLRGIRGAVETGPGRMQPAGRLHGRTGHAPAGDGCSILRPLHSDLEHPSQQTLGLCMRYPCGGVRPCCWAPLLKGKRTGFSRSQDQGTGDEGRLPSPSSSPAPSADGQTQDWLQPRHQQPLVWPIYARADRQVLESPVRRNRGTTPSAEPGHDSR